MNREQAATYTIRRTPTPPALDGNVEGAVWQQTGVLAINQFRPESSDHRPITHAKLLYDVNQIYVIFRVEDRYVRCVDTKRNGNMCSDSCVEFFVEPVAGRGYFNIEIGDLCFHKPEFFAPLQFV